MNYACFWFLGATLVNACSQCGSLLTPPATLKEANLDLQIEPCCTYFKAGEEQHLTLRIGNYTALHDVQLTGWQVTQDPAGKYPLSCQTKGQLKQADQPICGTLPLVQAVTPLTYQPTMRPPVALYLHCTVQAKHRSPVTQLIHFMRSIDPTKQVDTIAATVPPQKQAAVDTPTVPPMPAASAKPEVTCCVETNMALPNVPGCIQVTLLACTHWLWDAWEITRTGYDYTDQFSVQIGGQALTQGLCGLDKKTLIQITPKTDGRQQPVGTYTFKATLVVQDTASPVSRISFKCQIKLTSPWKH